MKTNKSVWSGTKPSWDDAPKWANWLAQDESGQWWWYEYEPDCVDGVWCAAGFIASARMGDANPFWEETLECRHSSSSDNT